VIFQRQVSRFFSTSRYASIPFALFYGCIIYFCVTYLIWPPEGSVLTYTPPTKAPSTNTTNNTHQANRTASSTASTFATAQQQKNINPTTTPMPNTTTIPPDINCTNKYLDKRRDLLNKAIKSKTYEPPTLRAHGWGIAIGAGVSGIVAFSTVHSQYARCVTMLVLPNIMSGRGRAALMTLGIGFLIDGPIASIQYNIEQIIESMTCLYRLMNQVSCRYNSMVEKAEGNNPPGGTKPPFLDTNGTISRQIVLPEIQKEFVQVLDSVKEVTVLLEVIFFWLKRVLIILGIILLVNDAAGYYRQYYVDVAHDNMIVDRSIRKLWLRGARPELTPLRRWEKKKRRDGRPGYKELRKDVVFTCFDFKEFIKKALPTIFFVMQAAFFVLFDWAMATLLQQICDKGAYEVMFSGLEHLTMKTEHLEFEWSISSFKVRRMKEDTDFTIRLRNVNFPLSDLNQFMIETKPCLPWPTHTKWDVRMWLLVITLCVCLTYVFEMFLVRARSMICNYFNAERADQRANDLYERLLDGRELRKHELTKIVSRELNLRRRRGQLSVLAWFMRKTTLDKRLNWSLKDKDAKRCPGCNKRMKKKKKDIKADICFEEMEEQRDDDTLARKRKATRLESMSSSDRFSYEADNISVDQLSVASDTILKHLDVSGDTKFQQSITREASRESSVAGGHKIGWHFLTTVLCKDCIKDVDVPVHEGRAERQSQLFKQGSKLDKTDTTLISDQESLSELVTGMWKS